MSRHGGRQLVGRAAWNLADQVLSSGTNLLLSLLLARTLSVDGFGAFAVAFAVYSLLVGASRSLIAQPLVVRYSSQGTAAFRGASRTAAGAATLLGIGGGAVTVVAALAIGGPTRNSLVAMGVLLPALLLQDMWRVVFTAEGRPAAALVNDLVWAVVQFVAVAVLIRVGEAGAPALIYGWAGAALVAAVIGGLQLPGHPRFREVPGWLYRQRDLLGYYAASFLTVTGASQVTMLLIAGLGDLSDIGALRAAQVVLGPLNLIGYSLSAFALPEIARREMHGRVAVTVAVGLSALLVAADLGWGVLALLLPDRIGVELLGSSWASAQPVLPAALLGVVAVGLGFGPTTLMVARGFARDVFWTNALLSPCFLAFGVLGLQLGGAAGAALGLALAQLVVVPVAWWRVLVLMRREPPGQDRRPAVPSGAESP